MSSPNYLRSFEEYNHNIEKAAAYCERYDALVLVGGSGPIVDMVNNVRVHDLYVFSMKWTNLWPANATA